MYYTLMVIERDAVMTVRLTREERDMLGKLAELDGVSISDVVRMLIRHKYAERVPAPRQKKRA